MKLRPELAELLAGFEKRMKFINIARSLIEYSYRDNIREMIEVGRILSEDFPYARIDLYDVDGTIYFGEITFYPWSGYVQFTPDGFDYRLGEYFTEYQ